MQEESTGSSEPKGASGLKSKDVMSIKIELTPETVQDYIEFLHTPKGSKYCIFTLI